MTVTEVFEKHQDLLFALMGRGDARNADTFAPVVAVLGVYANEIDVIDQITHQPHVTVTTVSA